MFIVRLFLFEWVQIFVWSLPMGKRRGRKLRDADKFHALAVSLLCVRHSDWWEREWEETFLLDQVQRPDDYVYSENQQAKLKQLLFLSRSFTEYAGNTIPELLAIAFARCRDLDDEDEQWVETLRGWRATDLKIRQISRLAGICRMYEPIGRDALTDGALDELRPDDYT
jgi:hypothetical protein